MPPFFDGWQFQTALENQAIPQLQRLADNSSLRERAVRRFDRDNPPRYASSTPSPEPPPNLTQDEIDEILERPFSEEDLGFVATELPNLYHPGKRYNEEAKIEATRVDRLSSHYYAPQKVKNWLNPRRWEVGVERQKIVTRRNIKRRWQKLGIWNPQWGIPDRVNNPQPNDDPSSWKWAWEGAETVHAFTFGPDGDSVVNPDHPISRALEPRRGLRRSDHRPVLPQSKLQPHISASEADAFIMSRPWFQFYLEYHEEHFRVHRLPWQLVQGGAYSTNFALIVERWKERGVWKEEWKDYQGRGLCIGWKWRNESPSPEPEDLTPLHTLEMEFTPSEVDALEDIPSPAPTPSPPPVAGYGRGHFSPRVVPEPLIVPPEELAQAPKEPMSTQPSPPVPKRRQRHSLDNSPALQPRRSARIAAMRAKSTQVKSSTTKKSHPARPPTTETGNTKRGRGHPKMSDKSGVSKKPKAPARPARPEATATQKQPRVRGRLRELPPAKQSDRSAPPVSERPTQTAAGGKPKRGRPRKVEEKGVPKTANPGRSGRGRIGAAEKQPRGRGRPRKVAASGVSKPTAAASSAVTKVKKPRGRGRPRKI